MSQATPARPATAAPARPPKPRTPWTVWAGVVGVVLMTVWAVLEPLGGIGFTLGPLFSEDLVRGREIIAEFLAPNWSLPAVASGTRSSRPSSSR